MRMFRLFSQRHLGFAFAVLVAQRHAGIDNVADALTRGRFDTQKDLPTAWNAAKVAFGTGCRCDLLPAADWD
jgi:hypothetical protein